MGDIHCVNRRGSPKLVLTSNSTYELHYDSTIDLLLLQTVFKNKEGNDRINSLNILLSIEIKFRFKICFST